ncbi:MAG: sigma factor, partial [Aquihabitans sp.]
MKVETAPGNGFEAVYRARATPLLRLALLLCGSRDQAEDAVAEAVARSWGRWETGTIDDLEAYLRRAVVNAITDSFRSRGRARDRTRRRSGDDRTGHDQSDVGH